jgi:hypothetical protein
MALVKSIEIHGKIPFDGGDNDELLRQLGRITLLQSLSFTLGEGDYVPNEHGGKTCRYSFTLVGQEAVSYKWVEHFCDLIRQVGGEIEGEPFVQDLEA